MVIKLEVSNLFSLVNQVVFDHKCLGEFVRIGNIADFRECSFLVVCIVFKELNGSRQNYLYLMNLNTYRVLDIYHVERSCLMYKTYNTDYIRMGYLDRDLCIQECRNNQGYYMATYEPWKDDREYDCIDIED